MDESLGAEKLPALFQSLRDRATESIGENKRLGKHPYARIDKKKRSKSPPKKRKSPKRKSSK